MVTRPALANRSGRPILLVVPWGTEPLPAADLCCGDEVRDKTGRLLLAARGFSTRQASRTRNRSGQCAVSAINRPMDPKDSPMRVVKFSLAAGVLSTVFLGIVVANAVLAPDPGESPRRSAGLDDDRLQEHLSETRRGLSCRRPILPGPLDASPARSEGSAAARAGPGLGSSLRPVAAEPHGEFSPSRLASSASLPGGVAGSTAGAGSGAFACRTLACSATSSFIASRLPLLAARASA